MWFSRIRLASSGVGRPRIEGFSVYFNALNRYKALYSNLLIPTNFVIGSDDKSLWPEKMHGYHLGRHVSQVRHRLKKNMYPVYIVKELDKMGFVRDVQEMHQNHVLLAFQTYVDKHGHGNVPYDFIIGKDDTSWPKETRGFNLGNQLIRIRKGDRFAGIKEQLKAIGVPVDSIYYPRDFDHKFNAVQKYKQIYGHAKVPTNFVVPKDDLRFPDDVRGFKLGAWLGGLRHHEFYLEHRQRLQDLGVEFVSDFEWVSFDVIKSTLEAFQTVYGHNRLHPSFIVPSGDVRFPEEMWGESLLRKIKELKLWKQVKSLGFIDASEVPTVKDNSIIMEALRVYKAQRGHLLVPKGFTVDASEAGWSEKFVGMRLGRCVCELRTLLKYNLLSEDVVKQLDELGFVRSLTQQRLDSMVLAFQTYKEKYGNLRIPDEFVVDDDDESWPEATRGMRLGRKLTHLRRGAFSDNIRDQLESMGVDLERQRLSQDFERNFAALLVYQTIHGTLKVPYGYVVPSDDNRYTEEMKGIRLGSWLADCRNRGIYSRHRQRLVEIGVDFSASFWVETIPFDELMKTLEAFKTVYGHQNIHPTFVVPADDERFPEIMWGVELGKKIRSWRSWKDIKALGFTNLKRGQLAIDVSELQQWISQAMPKSKDSRK